MAKDSGSFGKTIESVRESEKEALKIKEMAREKSQEILLSAKKDAEKIRLEGEKEALALKEKRIAEGKKSTEAQVGKILSGAKTESSRIKAKKVDSGTASFLLGEFLASFQ
jgi:vacuolar-type H+-ATPase subunit H